MNQVILFLLILNPLNTRQVLQEILMMLVLVKLVMMQTKLVKNETEIVIPLKHISNFWIVSNIPLINFEIELILMWPKECVLADITARATGNNNDPPAIVAPNRLDCQITDTKLDIPVVTLSKKK